MTNKQQSLDLQLKKSGPVECLGMTFENDEARRAHFLERLKEKLHDPEFRKIPGFPKGTDEDILRMSNPPYYTACPNPFLKDFVQVYGRPYNPSEEYHREPLTVDLSEGKSHPLYQVHTYHTKVPHLAIAPLITHYSSPSDIILDGFAGSGSTGVAVNVCATDDGSSSEKESMPSSQHKRLAILNDLSPIATFIASNYTLPFDCDQFVEKASRLLDRLNELTGWMYETSHNGNLKGVIEYTVWSQVFTCSNCASEILFTEGSSDAKQSGHEDVILCRECGKLFKKSELEPALVTDFDPILNQPRTHTKYHPTLIRYRVGKQVYEKVPDSNDLTLLQTVVQSTKHDYVPVNQFPFDDMWEAVRLEAKGISHVHHLFMPRALYALATLWRLANEETDQRMRNALLFFAEQGIITMSLMNRYQPQGFKQVNKYLPGAYYIPSVHCEISPRYALGARAKRIADALKPFSGLEPRTVVTTGTCSTLPLPQDSVDYIFTDPPFGDNIPYSELNFLTESWHGVVTDPGPEAVVDRSKRNPSTQKSLSSYRDLLRKCLEEYYRVLKPGRWLTLVFSNSSNAVWRSIQEALGTAGFIIADVRTLDKQLGSFKQVTSAAMKQDLVISAYKPTTALESHFKLQSSTPESAWAFVDEHLSNLPLLVSRENEGELVAERTAQMLLDRMIACHVQRGLSVPLSAGEFFAGLEQRYKYADGMYFLPEQLDAYLRQRSKVGKLRQLSYHINDEASARLWIRAELDLKPQSFPELNHTFLQLSHGWVRHEKAVELKAILEENFLLYDGTGPVPAQIHTYLSTNFKDMRGLSKDDPVLKAKAAGRWYVPDPNKQVDLDQLRTKRLLKEFLEYKESKQKKLKQFRTEAIRAGFKAAYEQKDYRTIVEVAKRLPEQVIQEDEKLLMYYDVASMRLGED